MEDVRIIEMYWQRDEGAIAATQAKYGAFCRAIAWQILQDKEDAAECENDTYLRTWESIPPEKPRQFSAYLGAITRRLSLDCWRKKHAGRRGGGQVPLSLDELGECIPGNLPVERQVESNEMAAVISAFLRALPRTECDVFLRRYWYLDSVEQIAQRYGFSVSKVKMTLKRTRDQLRECLEKEGALV